MSTRVNVDWTHRGEDGQVRGIATFSVEADDLRDPELEPQFHLTRHANGTVTAFNDYTYGDTWLVEDAQLAVAMELAAKWLGLGNVKLKTVERTEPGARRQR